MNELLGYLSTTNKYLNGAVYCFQEPLRFQLVVFQIWTLEKLQFFLF